MDGMTEEQIINLHEYGTPYVLELVTILDNVDKTVNTAATVINTIVLLQQQIVDERNRIYPVCILYQDAILFYVTSPKWYAHALTVFDCSKELLKKAEDDTTRTLH